MRPRTPLRKNIQDAVRGFLEAAGEQGTLADILEEAGYRKEGDDWRAPEFVSVDRMVVGLAERRRSSRFPYQTLVRIFEKEGFAFSRQSGDHLIYSKAGSKRPLVIPARPTRQFPCSSSGISCARQA